MTNRPICANLAVEKCKISKGLFFTVDQMVYGLIYNKATNRATMPRKKKRKTQGQILRTLF